MDAYQLQTVSCYSFGSSSIKSHDYVSMLSKYDYQGGGICDLNSLRCFADFASAFSSAPGLIPALGMIIKVKNDEESFLGEIVILSEEGYLNAVKICNQNKDAYELNDLKPLSSGLAFILKTEDAKMKDPFFLLKENAFFYQLNQVYKDFYFGLEIYSSGEAADIKNTLAFLEKYPYSYLAFPKAIYLDRQDSFKAFKILEAFQAGKTLQEQDIDGSLAPYFLLTPGAMVKVYGEKAVLNQSALMKKIHFDFLKKRGGIISEDKEKEDAELRKEASEGLEKKLKGQVNSEYAKRLDYELGVIAQMSFSSYFLIVADYVSEARREGIYVGPGRGSSCSSLVAYSLDITRVDPLKFDLSFERFLNPLRKNPPDIDVDFESEKRGQVISYLVKKYGADRVGLIITYSTLQLRSSLDAVRRTFAIPEERVKSLSSLVSGRNDTFQAEIQNNEKFRLAVKDPYFKDIEAKASLLLGYPVNYSTHASGVLISNKPLCEVFPCVSGSILIAGYEFAYLEEMGFLKFDILALSNLSFIHQIEDAIKELGLTPLNPYENLDDPETFKVLNRSMVGDIFQLDHWDMEKAIKEIHPDSIADLTALLALNRPGPMAFIPDYAKRKNTGASYALAHKDLERILKPTYGIMVYQEQILEIAKQIAGFNGGGADLFRRAISKKDASKMAKMKEKFLTGSMAHGLNQEQAQNIYDMIVRFADYGFNKAHAAAYALVTYALLFYKAHYPSAFYLCSFRGQSFACEEKSASRRRLDKLLKEAKSFGFGLKAPSVNASEEELTFAEGAYRIGFNQVSLVNKKLIDAIMTARAIKGKFVSLGDFFMRVSLVSPDRPDIGLRDIDPGLVSLVAGGAFDEFKYDREEISSNLISLLSMSRYASGLNPEMFMPDIKPNGNKKTLGEFISEFNALGLVLSDQLSSHLSKPASYKKLYLLTDDPYYIPSGKKYVLKVIDEKEARSLFLFGAGELHKYDIISANEDLSSRYRDITDFKKEEQK